MLAKVGLSLKEIASNQPRTVKAKGMSRQHSILFYFSSEYNAHWHLLYTLKESFKNCKRFWLGTSGQNHDPVRWKTCAMSGQARVRGTTPYCHDLITTRLCLSWRLSIAPSAPSLICALMQLHNANEPSWL